jgi:hypothetical protein
MKSRSGAMPPLLAGLAIGAAAGAAATWRLIRRADGVKANAPETAGDQTPPALLPRLFLLQAFSEQIEEVAHDVVARDDSAWNNAADKLEEALKKIKAAVLEPDGHRRNSAVCAAVGELVQLLKDKKVDQWVQGYLPREGQSWELLTREQMRLSSPDGGASHADAEDAFESLLEPDENRERVVLDGFHLVLEDLFGQIAALRKAAKSVRVRGGIPEAARAKEVAGYQTVKVF